MKLRLRLARLILAPCMSFLAAMPVCASRGGDDAIAWFDGGVDAAFARARASDQPLFLYWGASWCPPCNEIQATIFRRAEFIERTRRFVPVRIDGDEPGAQALADRFHVRNYPTMILFSSTGAEVTRLQGEADMGMFLQALSLALGSVRTAREVIDLALGADPGRVRAPEWTLLSSYFWEADEGRLFPPAQLPAGLLRLARACPSSQRADCDRLAFAGVAAAARGPVPLSEADRAWALARARKVIADGARSRMVFDDLAASGPGMVEQLLPDGEERREFALRWDEALGRQLARAGLFPVDRLIALMARARLEVMAQGAASAALRREISAAARAAAAIRDPYERMAAVSAAGDALSAARQFDEADALLQAELARTSNGYYTMIELAALARARGDPAQAIGWYEKAFAASRGDATRVQWGSRYVIALMELAPGEPQRAVSALEAMIATLPPDREGVSGRNAFYLRKVARAIDAWEAAGAPAEAVARSRALLAGTMGGEGLKSPSTPVQSPPVPNAPPPRPAGGA